MIRFSFQVGFSSFFIKKNISHNVHLLLFSLKNVVNTKQKTNCSFHNLSDFYLSKKNLSKFVWLNQKTGLDQVIFCLKECLS